MLLLHVRTIAFIASLSTAIQSLLWIIGYACYILTFSCVLTPNTKCAHSMDLACYFVMYFQGSNCTHTSSSCFNDARWINSTTVVSIFSVGLGWNLVLLTFSIYLVVGLHKNATVYGRVIYYSIVLGLVSVYDVALVAIIGYDFNSIMKEGRSKKTCPYLEYGYLDNVLTVIALILSRFVFIWIVNVIFAICLLKKNAKNDSQYYNNSLPRANRNSNKMKKTNEGLNNGNWEHPKPGAGGRENGDLFGKRAPKDSSLSMWQVPPPPLEDEVNNRWIMSSGTPALEKSNQNMVVEDWTQPGKNWSLPRVPLPDERWNEVENHIKMSDDHWRKPSFTHKLNQNDELGTPQKPNFLSKHEPVEFVSKPVQRSSFRPGTEPIIEPGTGLVQRPSFLKALKENRKEARSTEDSNEDLASPAKKDGFFRYIPTDTGVLEQVKLRHVGRKSIPNEDDINDISNNTPLAVAYAISPIPGMGREDSRSSFFQLDQPLTAPPDPPPPPAGSNPFSNQMSLEEAIRTRRPLKPVKRPGIDTTC